MKRLLTGIFVLQCVQRMQAGEAFVAALQARAVAVEGVADLTPLVERAATRRLTLLGESFGPRAVIWAHNTHIGETSALRVIE